MNTSTPSPSPTGDNDDNDDSDDGDDNDDGDDDNDNTLRFQTFQISLKIYCDENAYFAFCVQLPDLVVVAPF